MAKKRNWEKLQAQDAKDTVRNRDVYEDQQLDRTKIKEKQSPLSRIIFSAVIGLLAALLVYFVASGIQFGAGMIQSYSSQRSQTVEYYTSKLNPKLPIRDYYALDEQGNIIDEPVYDSPEEVPVPDWAKSETPQGNGPSFGEACIPNWWKVLASLVIGGIVFGALYTVMMRNLDAQNLMSDTSDINQYQNDQHVALPEEVQRKYDWFPDVGAHSDVQPSSMISHMALSNKGLKSIKVAKRAQKDILDEDGDVEYYKGEILLDDNGEPIMETKPIIDEKFMDALFDASGALNDKSVRKYYDATKIPYNPDGKDREKLPNYKTVADLINGDWEFPEYEVSRPAGAYVVDTAPVNTMVLAITRAGKGQTVIEPTIDMWTREKRPNNMVINDPKGELLVKNYVRATVRGFQVVQFNLINAMKTDIYNRVPRSVMKSYSIAIVY